MSVEDERRPGKPGSEQTPAEPPRAPAADPVRASAASDPKGSSEPARPAESTRPRDPGPAQPPPRELRSALDLVPEILRRGLSAGRDVSDALFPRELASNLAAQLVDARHGLVTAIANEVGRFLRQADIASELRKVLAGLQVEAKIQLRFSEDPQGQLKTKVEVEKTSPPNPTRKPSKPPSSET